jgi:hypothetical protein
MVKDAFERIFNEYAKARTQKFANHPLAEYIRSKVPELFAIALSSGSDMKWEGA